MNDVKNIIAVETSSDICGISFISNGICLKTIREKSERKHIEKIPLFYKRLQESIARYTMSLGYCGEKGGLTLSQVLALSVL